MTGEYWEGRAEGLALALLAILEEIRKADEVPYGNGCLDNVAGFIVTNITMGQNRVLAYLRDAGA